MLRESFTYRLGARYYQPQISRRLSVDPLAEKYPAWSPYNYTADNPVMLVDPDGRALTDFIILETGDRVHVEDGKDQVLAITLRMFSQLSDMYINSGKYRSFLGELETSKYNLHLKTKEYNEIAGTIINEASVNGPWEESAAIYSVLRNRGIVQNKSVLEETRIGGVAGHKEWENIYEVAYSVKRMNNVNKGIAMAIVTGHDYSNGAYWWDGVDFNGRNPKNNGGYTDRYLQGYRFTDPSHDYWHMGNYAVNGHARFGNYKYKYESTAFYGRTTFSRLTIQWRKVQRSKGMAPPYP